MQIVRRVTRGKYVINIVYTLNDGFVPQVGAGICSVCENNKRAHAISFYIISYGISDNNKSKLTKLVYSYQRQIQIIEVENISAYFDFSFDTTGWNPVVLLRLLLDKLIPDNVNKLIYLDGDTIVRGCLDDLWETNIDNKVFGMSIEPTVDKSRYKQLNIE